MIHLENFILPFLLCMYELYEQQILTRNFRYEIEYEPFSHLIRLNKTFQMGVTDVCNVATRVST